MSKSLDKCLYFPFPVYWTSNRLKYHNILDEFENTNIIFHRDAPCGVDPRITPTFLAWLIYNNLFRRRSKIYGLRQNKTQCECAGMTLADIGSIKI